MSDDLNPVDSTGRSNRPLQVAVIGAGIAGLTAARRLVDHGHAVVVLDKGNGPGGRASSRRRQGYQFDHGAQYFTARHASFRRQVDVWLQEGVVARWSPRLVVIDADGLQEPRGKHERFVGVPGMSALAQHLARDLEVRSCVKVERLESDRSGWLVRGQNGDASTAADFVIVTVPPAQAVPLLTAAPRLAEEVSHAVMRPCWALMLGYAEPLPVGFDGAFVNVGPLAWVARNSSKPRRDGGESWVLHARAGWSEENLERDATDVSRLLRAEFADRCAGSPLPAPAHAEAHRWRYAQPEPALAASCLLDAERRIGVAGDWCGEGRLEGAFLSGMSLADRILGMARPGSKETAS